MSARRRTATVPVAASLLFLVAACAGEQDPGLDRGPEADSAACDQWRGALPAQVLGGSRAGEDAQGNTRWGSPAVVAGCGHTPLGPTTKPCLDVDGIEWVVDDPEADPIRFTTYGRSPAVVVLVPASYGRESASGALADLGPAAARLPRSGPGCG